jgi:cyclophilin family peptidyl-prolyl cis-trans isomerase
VLLSLLLAPAAGSIDRSQAPLIHLDQIPTDETAPAVFAVTFETTQGRFVIEAHRDWAPIGVDRFYTLVKHRFFDDSRFFRVRAGFIAQFGVAGEPRTATAWRNRAIQDDPVKQSNKRGTVAFAMTGPNTRTTQIYINLADNARLDAQGFAPIGTVVRGMEAVDKLYSGYDEASGGGMRGGKQDRLFAEGTRYLDKEFPRLDKLLRARISATSNKTD